MPHFHRWIWLPMLLLIGGGCRFRFADNTPFARGSYSYSDYSQVEQGQLIIKSKRIANLSEDGTTITLAVDAYTSGTGALSYRWEELSDFGNLNSNRGEVVQWKAESPNDYTATIRVTVSNGEYSETADFKIPVRDGIIEPAELMPEIAITPQSAVLIKALPLAMLASPQENLTLKTSLALSASCYEYDQGSNRIYKSFASDELTWSTSNPALVHVSEAGLITPADGCEVGEAIITATANQNAACKASIPVKVGYLETEVQIRNSSSTVYLKGLGLPSQLQLETTVTYRDPNQRGMVVFTDSKGQEITWSSGNPEIAQIDPQGLITVLEDATVGNVIFTARSNYDPSRVATVSIKVLGQ